MKSYKAIFIGLIVILAIAVAIDIRLVSSTHRPSCTIEFTYQDYLEFDMDLEREAARRIPGRVGIRVYDEKECYEHSMVGVELVGMLTNNLRFVDNVLTNCAGQSKETINSIREIVENGIEVKIDGDSGTIPLLGKIVMSADSAELLELAAHAYKVELVNEMRNQNEIRVWRCISACVYEFRRLLKRHANAPGAEAERLKKEIDAEKDFLAFAEHFYRRNNSFEFKIISVTFDE